VKWTGHGTVYISPDLHLRKKTAKIIIIINTSQLVEEIFKNKGEIQPKVKVHQGQ
jgi:hypothetical protein